MAEQLALPLKVAVSKEVNGLDMGVLEDGTPYLSGRSLATLCGIAASALIKQADYWSAGRRDNKLAKMLVDAGIKREHMYIKTTMGGTTVHAYPDDVSMIILEYYAFESDSANDTAKKNYRILARASLRQFIYRSIGYDPQNRIPEKWTKFHDRLILNTVPRGYFSVFREMSDLVLTAIQSGLVVDEHTVPDISVGQLWSRYWKEIGLEAEHGPSIKHPHFYPDYFPQAAANGFIDANVYPLGALGAFRVWMQTIYLPQKFPRYLDGKVQKGMLPASAADLIIAALDAPVGTGAMGATSPVPALPAKKK